jgi:hypothetical protein
MPINDNPETTSIFNDVFDLPTVAAYLAGTPTPNPELATLNTKVSKTKTPRQPPPPNSRISVLYGYKALTTNASACKTYEKQSNHTNTYKWATEEGLLGIEIEVENITNGVVLSPHWSTHGDGSLRNHGIEFVSVPLAVNQIEIALHSLYAALKQQNQPDFSNRTSVHIHLNCRDLTQDEIYALVLLYAIFEKHFYGFAGTKRLNSIFCVPLYRCNILNQAKEVIYGFNPVWHKYCGINILPLVDNNGERGKGTIEFRHLYGTDDVELIFAWINQILCLRKACKEIKLSELLDQIKTMNTTSDYLALFYRVFTGQTAAVRDKQVFEESISNIKRELFSSDYAKTITRSDTCQYWQLAAKLGLKG